MIVWSGHGILIPIFGVIGAFIGGVIGGVLGHFISPEEESVGVGCGMIFAGWFATAAVFFYAKTIGKTTSTQLIDPRTNTPVVINKRHSLFFIPAVAWPFISGAVALFLSVMAIPVINSKPVEPGDIPPAQARFSAADLKLTSKNDGIIHGNSKTALSLAREFSRRLKIIREMGITEDKKNAISLSGGEFVTRCELSRQGVAFMVHVPGLRKFDDGAKDFIAEAATRTAVGLAGELSPKPEKVAVGIRGAILYDRIIIGKMPPDGVGDLVDQESFSGSKKEVLISFFDDNPEDTNYVLADQSADETPPPASAKTPAVPSPASAGPEPAVSEAAPAVPSPAPASPEPATVVASEAAAAVPSPLPATQPSIPSDIIALPTQIRDWQASDGRPLQAALVRFVDAEGKSAEFKRADGQTFTIPCDRFSPEDQEFLRRAHGSQQ